MSQLIVSDTEEATVLAALRLYARYLTGETLALTDRDTDPFLDIASSGGVHIPLGNAEVEELGDRINLSV